MAPKRKLLETESAVKAPQFHGRNALGAYIADPEAFPEDVIYHTENFVAIYDHYPKSTIHALLLPRSQTHTLKHPFDAFKDPEFLAACQQEVEKLKVLVAKELQRRVGSCSQAEAKREAALNGEVELAEDEELPQGRDWMAEVITGIHIGPSMNHLHIHVLSRDMHSPCMKHRKHYNSFTTPFLVDVADFPLKPDDRRLDAKEEHYLRWDFTCWRCGKGFGNQFKKLKDHLDAEFREWLKE